MRPGPSARRTSPHRSVVLAGAVLASAGCATSISLPSLDDGTEGSGGGTTSTRGTGGSTTTSSTSTSTSTGTGSGGATTTTSTVPGSCTTAADCVDLSDGCNQGTCVNGACTKVPANDFGACDDGLFCTVNESCSNGVCGGGTPNVCAGQDACHVGTCNEQTKSCDAMPGNDGAACSDGDPCTQTAVCSAGQCVAETQKDCSFLDATCGKGTCDKVKGCVLVPSADGTPCDDGLYCTVQDACKAGACGGVPNTCAAPGDVCMIGTCDEGAKTCVAVPGNDGAKCASGNECMVGETCGGGKCGGGVPGNDGKACKAADACQLGTTCSAGVCGNAKSVISQCLPNDGCCPPGCDGPGSPDNDCKPALGILAATPDPSWIAEVAAKQTSLGAFLSVTTIDAKQKTPTVADLQQFGVVLVFSDAQFQNPALLGDNLADYYDGGGRVVLATFANASVPVTGKFGNKANGYLLLDPAGQDEPSDSLGNVAEPQSPLMNGVKSLSASAAYRSTGAPINGAVVVASWGTGAPLVVRGTVKGRNRADVNLYPPSSASRADFWSGDGAELLRNALLFK